MAARIDIILDVVTDIFTYLDFTLGPEFFYMDPSKSFTQQELTDIRTKLMDPNVMNNIYFVSFQEQVLFTIVFFTFVNQTLNIKIMLSSFSLFFRVYFACLLDRLLLLLSLCLHPQLNNDENQPQIIFIILLSFFLNYIFLVFEIS